MEILPNEIVFTIFTFYVENPTNILKLCHTCPKFRAICESEENNPTFYRIHLWKQVNVRAGMIFLDFFDPSFEQNRRSDISFHSVSGYLSKQRKLKDLSRNVERSQILNKQHKKTNHVLRLILKILPIFEALAMVVLLFLEQFEKAQYILLWMFYLMALFWLIKIALTTLEYWNQGPLKGKERQSRIRNLLHYLCVAFIGMLLGQIMKRGTWITSLISLMLGNLIVVLLFRLEDPAFGNTLREAVELLSE